MMIYKKTILLFFLCLMMIWLLSEMNSMILIGTVMQHGKTKQNIQELM